MINQKIKLLKKDFTKSQIKIADYLKSLTSYDELNSYSLAKSLNISQATIIRFSKKLGYNSFYDLVMDVRMSINSKPDQEIEIEETLETTNSKIINQYINVVLLSQELNDTPTLQKAIDKLYLAKSIVLYGRGSSFLIAEYFANQLTKIGLNVFISNDYDLTCTKVSQLNSDHLCFIISDQGRSNELVRLAKASTCRSIPLITLTRATHNKLQDLATIPLKTVNYDTTSRLKSMSMRCSQLCVLDMLYLNLIKKDYQRFNNSIDSTNSLFEFL